MGAGGVESQVSKSAKPGAPGCRPEGGKIALSDSTMEAHVIDGLWTVEFASSIGSFGGGVTVFKDGKISGGDNTYFYVGEYEASGTNFRATLRVAPFIRGAPSVFNTKDETLTLELTGALAGGDQLIAQGTAREAPGVKFAAKLTRRR